MRSHFEVLRVRTPTCEFVGERNSKIPFLQKPLTGMFPKNRTVDLIEAKEQVVPGA